MNNEAIDTYDGVSDIKKSGKLNNANVLAVGQNKSTLH